MHKEREREIKKRYINRLHKESEKEREREKKKKDKSIDRLQEVWERAREDVVNRLFVRT